MKKCSFIKLIKSVVILFPILAAHSALGASTNQVQKVTAKNQAEVSEIVISATRYEEESWKSGSSISVVPEDTFKMQHPFQIVDVVRGEPGVTAVNTTGVPGGLSQISIRGLPFSRTLVQVDGLRFNRPIDDIANFADLPPILTGNMEILRGPQSSLYGSEAQGGVVSMSVPTGKGKPSFGTSFEAGTFNTLRERLFSQGKEKTFDWNVEASRLDSDNKRPNQELRQNAAAMHLGYDFSEVTRLDLAGRWTDNTSGSPGAVRGFGSNDPDNRLFRRTALIAPSLTITPFEQWESKLTLGYIGVGQRSDSPPTANDNHSESLQLNWQNNITVTDWNTLIVGGEERNEHTTTGAASGVNVFNRATQSAYMSDNVRWEDFWGLTVSGRYDDNEGFRDAWTYRASQVFKLPVTESKIHMSFGTAFRAPAISELKNLFGPASGANAGLVPETTEGYDLGFTQTFLDGTLETDSTYFYNNVINLITTDAAFVFQNISEARTEGLENSLKWKATKNLNIRGALTLNSTTNKDGRFGGNDLTRIPRQTASLSATWTPLEHLELSSTWNYNGTTFDNAANTVELNDFHRIDIFANYQMTPWLKLFGRAENLLGYYYQQAANFPTSGRTFYGGFEFNY